MMNRKGLSATITLVIAIVVMVVIALAIIAVTTGNVTQLGGNTQKQTKDAFGSIENTASDTMLKAKCYASPPTECNKVGAGKTGKCQQEGNNCVWK